MSRAFNLYRLQQIDTRLDRKNARLAEIKKLLEDDKDVLLAKKIFSDAEDTYQNARKALNTAEENTKSQRIKIEQAESNLYSGNIKNPKELQDQQNEVAALKRYLEVIEERQIEAMLNFEETDSEMKAAETAVDTVVAKKLEGNAALTGEQSQLNAEVASLASERTVALVSISIEDLKTYEALRQKRAGVAVSDGSSRSCAACGSSINATLYQAVRSPSQLANCDNCGRILYAG